MKLYIDAMNGIVDNFVFQREGAIGGRPCKQIIECHPRAVSVNKTFSNFENVEMFWVRKR